MINNIDKEIVQLREEADMLLVELKEKPNEYRQIMNKYNAVMGKLRYRTKPEERERKIQYQREKNTISSKKKSIPLLEE